VSRKDPRFGGAIKGLAVVLGVLVGLLLYVAWQDSLIPWDVPVFLESLPLWVYIVLLSVLSVIAAAFGRAGVMAARARSAAELSTTRTDYAATIRRAEEGETPSEYGPRAPTPGRVMIDFVPVVRGPSKDTALVVTASPDDVPVVSASRRGESAVNAWPKETIPLGKPPRDRAPKAPPAAPAPLAVTRAIPEPYLGPELESATDPAASAPVEAVPVNAPPDTLLGRLMNWLDETSPEAVSTRRSRRSSKKHGR